MTGMNITKRLLPNAGRYLPLVMVAVFFVTFFSLASPQKAYAVGCSGIPATSNGGIGSTIRFNADTGTCGTQASGFPAPINGFHFSFNGGNLGLSPGRFILSRLYGTFDAFANCQQTVSPNSTGEFRSDFCSTGLRGINFTTDGTYTYQNVLTETALQGGNTYILTVNFSVIVGTSITINSASIEGGAFGAITNTPPVITSDGGGVSAVINVTENQTAVSDIQVSDDNDAEGAGITYSIYGGSDPASFNINAVTGVLTLATAPDFESPTDSNADNTYTVRVSASDSAGLIDRQYIFVTVSDTIEDATAPTVSIENAPAFFHDEDTTFSVTFQFSEDVTGFAMIDITTNNGKMSNFTMVDANTYTVDISPNNNNDITIDVAANVAIDAAGNGNIAAAQVVVSNVIVEVTQQVIASFLTNRANHILANQPDISGMLDGSSLEGGGDLGNLNFAANRDGMTLAFSSSLNRIMNKADKRIASAFAPAPDTDLGSMRIPLGAALNYNEDTPVQASKGLEALDAAQATPYHTAPRNFDIWTQVYGASASAGSSESSLWVGYIGAHYFVSQDLLIGGLVQIDWAEETNSILPGITSSASGTGWMVGPYLAGRIPAGAFGHTLKYEARFAWGRSDNDISPIGTFSDNFETTRLLASGKISGDIKYGDITITPEASVSWFEETQDGYTDSLANLIPSQTISLGEIRFGPDFSRTVTTQSGKTVTSSLGVSGLWNFGIRENAASQGAVLGNNQLRARLDGGISTTNSLGWIFGLTGYYDGLGLEDYNAFGAGVNLTIPLK